MYKVVKRDGAVAEFDIAKISAAISKAFDALNKQTHPTVIDLLALKVTSDFESKINATNSDWKEVDVYGTNNGNTSISSNSLTVDSNVAAAYKTATGASNVPQGSMACVIEGLDTEPNKITQVEVVIYMAGADTDCNDKGKTSTGDIKLFFDCADAKTAAPTAASVDSTGKLTMTGVKDATVEYQVDNGDWTKIGGTWNNTTFTSNALPESAKGKTIKVRQTETGKATSAEFTILADNNQWK